MIVYNKQKAINKIDDVTLVLTSLGGDRDSFCEIVTRYQNLLCSLAFASIGDIKQSEDLAQEVFIEAWLKLDTLREPEKLKSWLCGILRYKISHYLRKERNQPSRDAENIDEQVLADFCDLDIEKVAIEQQQQVLLWNTLSKIDITYREPLILFYRQQRSVERVADELDLTIDNAKQRLSRGRKLLKQAMLGFVEQALDKTKPGTAFTAGVVLTLADVTKSASATALGATSIKSASALKVSSLFTFLASLSGFVSAYFGLKASLYQSRTENEKKLSYKVVAIYLGLVLLWVGSIFCLKQIAQSNPKNALVYAIIAQSIVFLFVVGYLRLTFVALMRIRNLRAHERIFKPEAFRREVDQPYSKTHEYKSALSAFGIPLVHVQFGTPEHGESAAVGWIAAGSKAYGVIFAWGLIAVAPISVGVISVGFFTIGAIGIGILSFSAVAIGMLAFGASAIGYKAYASLSSLGWESAFSNGFSMANDAAVGTFAYAAEVNNEIANTVSNLSLLSKDAHWLFVFVALFVITPAFLYFKSIRKRM